MAQQARDVQALTPIKTQKCLPHVSSQRRSYGRKQGHTVRETDGTRVRKVQLFACIQSLAHEVVQCFRGRDGFEDCH